eukprot:scaffold50172_cov23-Tisochrysis_lutea.AAC.2
MLLVQGRVEGLQCPSPPLALPAVLFAAAWVHVSEPRRLSKPLARPLHSLRWAWLAGTTAGSAGSARCQVGRL